MPSSRSRSTQRHTVERETPISRAIRAPLTTMVAFSPSKVASAAIRRSVAPGIMVCGMVVEPFRLRRGQLTWPGRPRQAFFQAEDSAIRLCDGRFESGMPVTSLVFGQLGNPVRQLRQLRPAFRQSRLNSPHDFLRSPAAERFVGELPVLGGDVLGQAIDLLL